MATEIESFVRAWAQITGDGAGGFEWSGDGVDSITRISTGTFQIELTEAFDFKRTAFFLGPGLSASSPLFGAVGGQQLPSIDVVFANENGLPSDPESWSFEAHTGNTESIIQPVL